MKIKDKLLPFILLSVIGGLVAFKAQTFFMPMAARLTSLDDATRNAALSDISGLSAEKRAKTTADLLSAPAGADVKKRLFTFYALRKLGGRTPDALGLFARALSDPDQGIREEATVALLDAGEAALPPVAAVLKGPDRSARSEAAKILKKIGEPAIPELQACLRSADAELRIEAALALSAIHSPADETIPALVEAVRNFPWSDRSYESVQALELMGPAARRAVPDLTKALLASADGYSRKNAARPVIARALAKIDPRRSEPVDLGFDLKQKNPVVRYRAAFTLSEMTPPNPGAMEMLVGALADPDPVIAARALVALTRIGLEKTERLKKTAYPRIRSAFARGRAAKIEGFVETVDPEVKKIPG